MTSITSLWTRITYSRKKTERLLRLLGRCIRHIATRQKCHIPCPGVVSRKSLKTISANTATDLVLMMVLEFAVITVDSERRNSSRRLAVRKQSLRRLGWSSLKWNLYLTRNAPIVLPSMPHRMERRSKHGTKSRRNCPAWTLLGYITPKYPRIIS